MTCCPWCQEVPHRGCGSSGPSTQVWVENTGGRKADRVCGGRGDDVSQGLCHSPPGSLFWGPAACTVGDTSRGDQGVCNSSSPCFTLHFSHPQRVFAFHPHPSEHLSLEGSTISMADAHEIWHGRRGDVQTSSNPIPKNV